MKKRNLWSGHQSERLDERFSNEAKGGCYYEEDEKYFCSSNVAGNGGNHGRLHHTAGSRNRTDKYSSDRRTKYADSIAAGRFPVWSFFPRSLWFGRIFEFDHIPGGHCGSQYSFYQRWSGWEYNGPQDSVFEPGTEEANLVQQYQNAAQDILGSLKLEKNQWSAGRTQYGYGITAGGTALRHLLQCAG